MFDQFLPCALPPSILCWHTWASSSTGGFMDRAGTMRYTRDKKKNSTMRDTRFQPRMKPQPTTLEARVMTCPTASGARMLVTWSIRLMVAFIPFVGAKDTAVNMTPPAHFQQDHKVAIARAAFRSHAACAAAAQQTACSHMSNVRNVKKPIQIQSTQLPSIPAI